MTAPPASLAEIYAAYRKIAPEPSADDANPARSLAVSMLASAQRHFTKAVTPFAGDPGTDAIGAMCTQFAVVHLMQAIRCGRTDDPAALAREILCAWDDGGGIGEWLWLHARDLGVDSEKVADLTEAEVALKRVRADADGLESADADAETPGRPVPYKGAHAACDTAIAGLRSQLGQIRELARSWAERAPAERTLAEDLTLSPRDAVSADCGRCILGILDGEPGGENGETAETPDAYKQRLEGLFAPVRAEADRLRAQLAEHRDPAWRPE